MNRTGESVRRIIALTGLALAIAFLGVGLAKKHKVLLLDAEELAREFGLPPVFEPISDLQLVIDTTFSGVIRKGDRLQSTYDRSAPPQKRACPT